MMAKETTAAELLEMGLRPETASARLRRTVLERLRQARQDGVDREAAFAGLFEGTVLEPGTAEELVAGLVSGAHVLLLGPPGAGKTSIARAVWGLMPDEVFAVKGSPVQDDPFSLIDPVHARLVPPSPVVLAAYGEPGRPGHADPADVPVVKIRLREGHGMARVQGSPEVFPDNLTGGLNLARLEEIGDPNSPLVLEPGKLLQAHRGLLLVDEIGKLPRGTQNVLLQALQERQVTAAKSRETFPADFVAVTTSNIHDLGNITEPLTDRLSNVHVAFPADPDANRRIVDLGLQEAEVPGPYRDAAVRLVQRWRAQALTGDELGEVGSNRTLIDIVRRAWSHALLSGDALDPEDLRRGAREAMAGRIRARSQEGFDENRQLVQGFVERHWKEDGRDGAKAYWCRYFDAELQGDEDAARQAVEALRAAAGQGARGFEQDAGPVAAFTSFVARRDAGQDAQDAARAHAAWTALEQLGAFEA